MNTRSIMALVRAASGIALLIISASSNEAQALRFQVTELSQCPILFGGPICIGAEFTIGFRIEADPGEELFGLGVSAWGYDESVVDFVTGSAVPSIFHGVALPAIGAFNGLGNVLTNPLNESAIGSNGNRVLLFNGVGLSPVQYNPLDPGLDGVIGGAGTQFRITFRGTGPGVTQIRIGTGYAGDGAVYEGGRIDQSAGIIIEAGSDQSPTVVPEPGTALLLGLGLAGLADRRRRDARCP